GIVTIDGNGKDGVEAVADMVARLEAGCDYVQGSRYLPGGAAENTPLERTIANRLIHAPMLSLAARHWFTDTTNGFRAYSARYLTHPGVRPFRDEFSVYNLLFYLTVRAGQLGLRVAHVPVERRYPDDGKVPTKIGGFASKLALLKETAVAATGGYTPDGAAPRGAGWLGPVLVLAAILAALLASVIAAPPYSPDSWALYELSKTVFGDFYRFSHWRSYASASPYSASLAPLTPVLIAGLDAVLGTGARTGLYLAFACYAGFALVSERIGRVVTGAPWLGLGAALVLLLGPNMLLIEMSAGRTIPLQLLLYALILLALLRNASGGMGRAVLIGLLAGLAVLNRFDALPVPFLAAGALLWLTRSPANALCALAAAALTASPWVAYSLATFGTLFATDNAGTAMATDAAAYFNDWWPTAQPTLADHPMAWAARIAGNALSCLYVAASLLVSPMGLACAAFLAPPAAVLYLREERLRGSAGLWTLAGFAAAAALLLAPQVLTGYLDHRYFSLLWWSIFLAAACWGVAQGRSAHQRMLAAKAAFAIAALAAATLAAGQLAHSAGAQAARPAAFDAAADVRALQRCLAGDRDARILVLGDDRFAAKVGALAGLATMSAPRNMLDGRLGDAGSRAFLKAWQVDFVLVADPARAAWATAAFPLVRDTACPLELYRVAR
ncbi:MAG: hypothetical protein ACKO01_13110, partial [Erythrobacter sp.]